MQKKIFLRKAIDGGDDTSKDLFGKSSHLYFSKLQGNGGRESIYLLLPLLFVYLKNFYEGKNCENKATVVLSRKRNVTRFNYGYKYLFALNLKTIAVIIIVVTRV